MLHLPPLALSLLTAASVLLLLAATATDVAFRRVPNKVSAMLTVCGLILRLGSGSLLSGLIAAAAVFAPAAFCWRRGWLGGGDVKLLAAATLTLPPLFTPTFVLAVALAGGVLALVYLALSLVARRNAGRRATALLAAPPGASLKQRGVARFFQRLLRVERWRIQKRSSLPYAAAIAAGACFILITQ
ncbi:MAG: prepilin peptidase [Acetobacteraceae bacterium]